MITFRCDDTIEDREWRASRRDKTRWWTGVKTCLGVPNKGDIVNLEGSSHDYRVKKVAWSFQGNGLGYAVVHVTDIGINGEKSERQSR